jgi:methionine synthase I (cobalamin-dependent)
MARPSWAERVKDAHQRGKLILMDGPMGTELIQSGLNTDQELSHHWNLKQPEAIKVVYEDYSNSGADALLTNTFSAQQGYLKEEEDWQQAVDAAIELARQPEWDHLYTIGCIGSAIGSDVQFALAIREVAKALSATDAILLETQIRLDRVLSIASELPADPSPPWMVSFSYSRVPRNNNCWILESPKGAYQHAGDVASKLKPYSSSLLAIGANCGMNLRLSDYLQIVKDYRQQTDLPIFIRPGITPSIECEFSPKEYAEKVKDFADAGVTMLGGCCGTTPMHVAALRKEIDRLGLSWQE